MFCGCACEDGCTLFSLYSCCDILGCLWIALVADLRGKGLCTFAAHYNLGNDDTDYEVIVCATLSGFAHGIVGD